MKIFLVADTVGENDDVVGLCTASAELCTVFVHTFDSMFGDGSAPFNKFPVFTAPVFLR